MSVNERLSGLDTNKNGITYVGAKVLQEGDVFEGYLVGKHQDQDDPDKISCLILQDENKELFGLNSNYIFINGVNDAGVSRYDQLTVVYEGKKKPTGGKNFTHHWKVSKGSKRITAEDSSFGTATSGPQKVAGF